MERSEGSDVEVAEQDMARYSGDQNTIWEVHGMRQASRGQKNSRQQGGDTRDTREDTRDTREALQIDRYSGACQAVAVRMSIFSEG